MSYYPAKPHNIGKRMWCYIEPKGLCVVAALGDAGAVVMPRHIPWALMEKAVAIHRKAQRTKRSKP